MERLIEDISKEILEILQKNIKLYTYNFDKTPNEVYYDNTGKPTYQFFEAWNWDAVKKSLNGITRSLVYHPDTMDFNVDKWLHASQIIGWEDDARAYLHKILEETTKGDGYRTSTLGFAGHRKVKGNNGRYFAKKRKPYFKPTTKELDEKIVSMIVKKLANRGFVVRL